MHRECKGLERNLVRITEKYINIKYHHFRAHIQKGTITVKHVDTETKIADIVTKPLHAPHFLKQRLTIMGW